MIKILFVCHGNICRSPMAEFILKDLVKGSDNDFHIESRATSREEIGNSLYPPAKRKLSEYNISYGNKTAKQITIEDYNYFDYIICMASRRRAIQTRLKPLKIGFFFVVVFDIPRIIKNFRLEKSRF